MGLRRRPDGAPAQGPAALLPRPL
ncbi:MAG: hypothetical protein LOD85_03045 [Clostridia bacterium]